MCALCLFCFDFYMQIGVCHDTLMIDGRGLCPGLWLAAARKPPDIKGAKMVAVWWQQEFPRPPPLSTSHTSVLSCFESRYIVMVVSCFLRAFSDFLDRIVLFVILAIVHTED